MNPHRVPWVRNPGEKDYRCTAPGCWATANTRRAQQVHADIYEPRPLDTAGLIVEEASA